ncbi:unnamed protein product [Prunus armeniaca]
MKILFPSLVADVVFVSTVVTVMTLDCDSPRESCDTWWLIFCLCFNGNGNSDVGGSYWDMMLFSTLCQPKNYAWS